MTWTLLLVLFAAPGAFVGQVTSLAAGNALGVLTGILTAGLGVAAAEAFRFRFLGNEIRLTNDSLVTYSDGHKIQTPRAEVLWVEASGGDVRVDRAIGSVFVYGLDAAQAHQIRVALGLPHRPAIELEGQLISPEQRATRALVTAVAGVPAPGPTAPAGEAVLVDSARCSAAQPPLVWVGWSACLVFGAVALAAFAGAEGDVRPPIAELPPLATIASVLSALGAVTALFHSSPRPDSVVLYRDKIWINYRSRAVLIKAEEIIQLSEGPTGLRFARRTGRPVTVPGLEPTFRGEVEAVLEAYRTRRPAPEQS